MSAFIQWLNTTEAEVATEPSLASAVNNLRQSLSDKIVDSEAKPDAWLAQALKQSKSVFTCSGVLQLASNAAIDQSNKHAPSDIRMLFELPKIIDKESLLQASDVTSDVSAYQMLLPLYPSLTQDHIDQMMSRIISLCEPATFGVGKKKVLDPSYRSCDQLAPDSFMTSFTPIDTMPNIIHEIQRVLCPSIDQSTSQSLRVELYKLNIYSKGGTFKSHRDTPRSHTMIGSLVVCLPIPHQGGTLIVRHPTDGQSVNYNWQLSAGDEQKLNQVNWCAFYGDCEHEILPVTSGHRVTLTYNLYSVENDEVSTSSLHVRSPLDDRHVPFFTTPFPSLLRLLIRSPSFLPTGGKLGITCHHGYAHTSSVMVNKLSPRMLKGGDAMIYESVRALGLECDFVPFVEQSVLLPQFQPIFPYRSCYPDRCDGYSEYYEDMKDEDGEPLIVRKRMGYEPTTDVIWLNREGGVSEVQDVYPTYGNDPSTDISYSTAVFIVHIDRYDDTINGRNPVPLPYVEKTVMISQHPHPLTKSKYLSSFRCSLCHRNIDHYTPEHRWLCAPCHYYQICLPCQQNHTISQSMD